MAAEAEDLRQALRALAPEEDKAQAILAMMAKGRALVAAADKVGALLVREAELRKSIADAEAVYAAKLDELKAAHEGEKQKVAQEEIKAREAANEVIARVKREATNFIAQTEEQTGLVKAALVAEQAKLAEFRRQSQEEQAQVAASRANETKFYQERIQTLKDQGDRHQARVDALKAAEAAIEAHLAAVNAVRK